MTKITLEVSGMMCPMCEAHVNDAVRSVCAAKKVTSSHKKGITEVLTELEPDTEAIKAAIEKTGYQVLSVSAEPYTKKGLFSRK